MGISQSWDVEKSGHMSWINLVSEEKRILNFSYKAVPVLWTFS